MVEFKRACRAENRSSVHSLQMGWSMSERAERISKRRVWDSIVLESERGVPSSDEAFRAIFEGLGSCASRPSSVGFCGPTWDSLSITNDIAALSLIVAWLFAGPMPRRAAGIDLLKIGDPASCAACSYASSLSAGYGRRDGVPTLFGSRPDRGDPSLR